LLCSWLHESSHMANFKISACIITLNEAKDIRAACESVAWADEIIVVDSGSTDQTKQIAIDSGARVIERPWPGFTAQKQFAAEQAANDWILSLDADERVSEELRASIVALKQKADSELADGYLVPRRAHYMGRWIRGGGWYPDRQLRLYRKSKGSWAGAHVHEAVKMNTGARVGELEGDLLHYTVRTAGEHHRMIGERYAPLAAQKMFEAGRRTTPWQIATIGPATFIRNFILKGGFRDGLAGFSIATFSAHHAFLKYMQLWELQNGGRDPGVNGDQTAAKPNSSS
ncbi:MAG TPA: glycosyltransferase family 2 protein, partial [Pyrinomonadaceae bacterium]|nr:glycosyltransferase family 2 protein [Pyrinomonadaceae bacterium]